LNSFQIVRIGFLTFLVCVCVCDNRWGQVFILDAMAAYNPADEKEAATIAERVTPRLQHANSAVVLSAIKVIMRNMEFIKNENEIRQLSKKMAAPLVTLLSTEPEIQYVALRNIDIIVQKYPKVLDRDIKMFFCKYNDPIYVKLEKLEIMIKLAVEDNIDAVLMEFKEYATEIDVEFVRRSVRAIGRCAIKLERAAQRCIDVLLDLIKTKVNYVVQEAIIVIKDIFRKYPNRYEKIIGQLCENLDTLDEPEAKAAMIWIIGEYASRIEGADELLEVFVDTFYDETPQVQLQLLTATMKLFLTSPTPHTKELVTQVLTLSTEESDNPDLRDRGYVYWRLLSADPQAANTVVLAEKPTIVDDSTSLSDKLLNDLIDYIGTLASVYHKPPELFVPDYAKTKKERFIPTEADEDDEEDGVYESSSGEVDILGLGTEQSKSVPSQMETEDLGLDDFLGGPATTVSKGASPAQVQQAIPPRPVNQTVVLNAEKGKGLQISGCITRTPADELVYLLRFENRGQNVQQNLAVKFNKNTFGIVPGRLNVPMITPGGFADAVLPLGFNENQIGPKFDTILQIAVNTVNGIVYFQDVYDFTVLLKKDGKVSEEEFLGIWASLPEESEYSTQLTNMITTNEEALKIKLATYNIFYVAKQDVPENKCTNLYFSGKFNYRNEELVIVMELVIYRNNPSVCGLSVRCAEQSFIPFFEQSLKKILTTA
jgi:AP-1 complex subunit beta-1